MSELEGDLSSCVLVDDRDKQQNKEIVIWWLLTDLSVNVRMMDEIQNRKYE